MSVDIRNSNRSSDASFNIHDGVEIGRDPINVVDAEVLELAQAFQSFGTDGIFEFVCIYTALYPILVNCFPEIGCI